jgi:hypothetical protein
MNIFIRLIYSLLIAAAVVTFIGVSIATFYPGPTAPAYPAVAPADTGKVVPSLNQNTSESQYEKAFGQYQADLKVYNRNISIILMALAAVIVVLGLWLLNRSDIIGEGLALGGVGSSTYAIITASQADNRAVRFPTVTLFLASVIVVVYFKFQKQPAAQKDRSKRA